MSEPRRCVAAVIGCSVYTVRSTSRRDEGTLRGAMIAKLVHRSGSQTLSHACDTVT